jgi:hypothetical protein
VYRKAGIRVLRDEVTAPENHQSELERLSTFGVITPPAEVGDPLEDCPEIRLTPGTATALIETDRDET